LKQLWRITVLSVALAAAGAPVDALGGVEFAGLDEALERNARVLVRLASTPCDRSRWRIERLFRNADKELRGALEALGYYTYTLDKELSFEDPDCWAAAFKVQLGAPVVISDVRLVITGEAASHRKLIGELDGRKPEVGTVLNHGTYETFKRSVLTQISNRGFLDAEMIVNSVVVDEELTSAVIDIEVESGSRYRFGELSYTEGILDPDILHSYATFRPGDYYDSDAIARLHEQLRGSGFFASVSIRADPVDGSLDVPVIVNLQPAKRHQFSAGVGFSTDTGVHGKLGYANRRLNPAGHRLETELFASEVDSEVTGTYRWPHVGSRLSWFEAYTGYQRRRTDTSESDKTTVGFRWVRNRTERWIETPYIDLTYEDFLVADDRDRSTLLIPGITWEATEGRALRRIDTGWKVSVDLRGSFEQLASDATFGQLTSSAKYVRSMGQAYRLITRGELGTTFGEDVRDLPATVRFFTGGDTSVRGYDYESIGPLNDDGEVIGGSHLTTFSVEIERLVREDWAIAVFADTGSAFNDSDVEFKTGVGIGVRWFSPFGPIRFDLAHPLDDEETDYRFHITLGPDL
jgi:translocation and assembly module TamA